MEREILMNPAIAALLGGISGSGTGLLRIEARVSQALEEVGMIHLRARVRCEKDRDGLRNERTGSGNTARVPVPDWVEIEQIPNGYLLIHVYLGHTPFIHTWHATVDEAKEEAKSDFLVGEGDWEAVPPDDRTE